MAERLPTLKQQHRRVGALVRELRIGTGVMARCSHGEIAGALGVSRWHWSHIVNGRRAAVGAGGRARWASWASFEADLRAAAARCSGANN